MTRPAPQDQPAFYEKLGILIIGVVIVPLGLYSYFDSQWIKETTLAGETKQTYETCDHLKFVYTKCPDVALEHYFVTVITACFILSLISFILTFFVNMTPKVLRGLDGAYHVVSTVLLLAGGSLYTVSAWQIRSFREQADYYGEFKIDGKLAAGVLTMIQSLLYAKAAYYILKRKRTRNTYQNAFNT